MSDDRVTVLLVEDDDVDAEAVIRSIRRSQVPVDVVWVEDGLEALDVLRGQHSSRTVERPVIVLLDLNMPRMTGFEFLASMRQDPLLKAAIVFVLTASDCLRDISEAYDCQAVGYLVKSRLGTEYELLADLLQAYYQTVDFPAPARITVTLCAPQ